MIGDRRPTFAFGAILALTLAASARRSSAEPSPTPEQLYDQGQAAYSAKDYDAALSAWTHSYELSHAAGLLFNIGQAYRLRGRLGDCALAREEYLAFVRDADPSPQRALAEQYVAQLATCATTSTTTSSTSEVPTRIKTSAEFAPSLMNRKLAAVAIGASGVVLFASGAYLGAHAHTLGDEVTNACPPSTGCSWTAELQSKDAAGHRDTTLGYTFDALGIAAVVGAVAYYWFGVHANEVQSTPVALEPRAGGAVLSWARAW